MLIPEDFEELKPKFEEIRQLLNTGYTINSRHGMSDEACGYYTLALCHMETLVEEVEKKQGHSVIDALKRVGNVANSPEGAGVIGGVVAGASVPTFVTGLGGIGIAASGTAFGVAGLAGAAAATGGVALAGAAGAYLVYKGGAATLRTELGQRAKDQVVTTGKEALEQAKSVRSGVRDGFGRVRDRFSKSPEDDEDLPKQQAQDQGKAS